MKLSKILNTIEDKFKGKAIAYDDFNFGSCQYLTDDGRKCAIGLFIPDGHDAQRINNDVSGLLMDYPGLRKHMPFQDTYLLDVFQLAHDQMNDEESADDQKVYLMLTACDLYDQQKELDN